MKKKHQLIIYLSLIITLGLIISPQIGNCQSFQYIDLDNQYGNFSIQYNDVFNNHNLYNNPVLNFQLPNFNNQTSSYTFLYNDFNAQYNSSFNTASLFNPIYNPILNLQLTALIPFGGFNIPFGNYIFGLNAPFGGFSNWCPYSIPYSIPPLIMPIEIEHKYSREEAEEMCDHLEGFLEHCECIEKYTGEESPTCI